MERFIRFMKFLRGVRFACGALPLSLPLARQLASAAAAALLAAPLQAASFGASLAMDSEAMLRGISQSGGRPSLRFGVEIEAARGPYAGIELASVLERFDTPSGSSAATAAARCLQPGDPGYSGIACAAAKSHLPAGASGAQLERDRRLSLYAGVPVYGSGATLLQASLAQHYYGVQGALLQDYRELKLDASLQSRDGVYGWTSFLSDDYYGASGLSGGAEASYAHTLFTRWRLQLAAGAVLGGGRSVPDYGYGRVGVIWSQRRWAVALQGHATQARAEALYRENLVRPRLTLSVDYRLF